MKKFNLKFSCVLLLMIFFTGCAENKSSAPVYSGNGNTYDILIDHFSAREFDSGRVSREEIDLILMAGLRAPSSGNRQPWHFTVVEDEALARQLVPQSGSGNVLFLISAAADDPENNSEILDTAMAVHSIYLAAQAIGLGSRIYTNPVSSINSRFLPQLGIPPGHSVIAVVRVGRLSPNMDAFTTSSPRHSMESSVTFR